MSGISEAVSMLDERVPGWRGLIDVDRLNMSSVSDCVLGQLFGTFDRGLSALGVKGVRDADAFCGYASEWTAELRPPVYTLTLDQNAAELLADILYRRCVSRISDELGLGDLMRQLGATPPERTKSNDLIRPL